MNQRADVAPESVAALGYNRDWSLENDDDGYLPTAHVVP
jgi:hypothetical protein